MLLNYYEFNSMSRIFYAGYTVKIPLNRDSAVFRLSSWHAKLVVISQTAFLKICGRIRLDRPKIHCMQTSYIPRVRVAPELRAEVESVLLKGETLSSFIRASLMDEALWRLQAGRRLECRKNIEQFQKSRKLSRARMAKLQAIEININAKISQMRQEAASSSM
jgi:hypothetical protein